MSELRLLIPVRRQKELPGRFAWPGTAVLAAARTADIAPLEGLAAAVRRDAGVRVRVAQNGFGPAAVRVRHDGAVADPEGYRLTVWTGGVEIEAGTDAGAYYGIQTLRELVRAHGRELPACRIDDAPAFRRRGVYLDCSRGKVPTVATLKRLVEYLAGLKINELQLYIENVFTFSRHPRIGRGFSPFTPAELLEVQDHCRLHHIRFVPSLTSFGHFERILALPGYAALGEKPGHQGLPGGTTLCPTDAGSIKLVAEMYEELLPLFEAVDFNACCDETWELGQGRSARKAARVGTGRLYLDFIRRLYKLCERHGKRMNIWADIVLNHAELIPELPPDVVMLNWDYSPNGARIPRTRAFREAGLPFVVCPGTSGWGSHGTRLANAMANVRVFAREGLRQGAQGLLNTDWGDCGHRNSLGVSLHGYAHGAAHAWCSPRVDDAAFTVAFCRHVLRSEAPELAAAVRTLGESEDRAGVSLYYSFLRPLRPRTNLLRGIPRISPVWRPDAVKWPHVARPPSDEGCRRVIAALEGADGWRRYGGRGGGAFVGQALEDIVQAARMDVLACRRLLAASELAARGALTAGTRRRLASEHAFMVEAFQTNWLSRNKLSRLSDNLRLFANVSAEYDEKKSKKTVDE